MLKKTFWGGYSLHEWSGYFGDCAHSALHSASKVHLQNITTCYSLSIGYKSERARTTIGEEKNSQHHVHIVQPCFWRYFSDRSSSRHVYQFTTLSFFTQIPLNHHFGINATDSSSHTQETQNNWCNSTQIFVVQTFIENPYIQHSSMKVHTMKKLKAAHTTQSCVVTKVHTTQPTEWI